MKIIKHLRSGRALPVLGKILRSWVGFGSIKQKEPSRREPTTGKLSQTQESGGQDQVALGNLGAIESVVTGDIQPLTIGKEAPELDVHGSEMLIVLTLMGMNQDRLRGARITEVLEKHGFVFGARQLFHWVDSDVVDNAQDIVFSVANAVEPGTLEPSELALSTIPGLALILILPGPLSGEVALARMLRLGEAMARELDGQLCDETRSALTAQGIQWLHDRVMNFERLRCL